MLEITRRVTSFFGSGLSSEPEPEPNRGNTNAKDERILQSDLPGLLKEGPLVYVDPNCY